MRSPRNPVNLPALTVSEPTLIKKYGNRRLYDTGESCYITLEELSRKIRAGTDVRVIDAKSGEDLTQGTLTQIIIEGRGAARMLPVPLLMQLIRLGDDVLAEFFGRYLSDALTLYLEMKRGASAVARYNPFAAVPLAASDALARVWMGVPFGGASRTAQPTPTWTPASAPSDDQHVNAEPNASVGNSSADHDSQHHEHELARLRREFDEFKRSMLRSSESSPEQAGEPNTADKPGEPNEVDEANTANKSGEPNKANNPPAKPSGRKRKSTRS
ncbi:MAG: hypothetical protein Tsb0020_26660 [Haliangiales bacterium]